MFIHFDRTHERGRQTDTACRHIPRLCIASRGKNSLFLICLGCADIQLGTLTYKLTSSSYKYDTNLCSNFMVLFFTYRNT